jgi:hypothetical protein
MDCGAGMSFHGFETLEAILFFISKRFHFGYHFTKGLMLELRQA